MKSITKDIEFWGFDAESNIDPDDDQMERFFEITNPFRRRVNVFVRSFVKESDDKQMAKVINTIRLKAHRDFVINFYRIKFPVVFSSPHCSASFCKSDSIKARRQPNLTHIWFNQHEIVERLHTLTWLEERRKECSKIITNILEKKLDIDEKELTELAVEIYNAVNPYILQNNVVFED